MANTWKRLAPGYYTLTIGPGETDRFEAMHISAEEMSGTGYGAHWNFTPPGSWEATDSAETLRECKHWAELWLQQERGK